MLSLLHIEHIALIESADISFGDGLNILTGETGAGKSIVLDSISAVMGERTSRDLIRTGEKSALVSGVFCDLPNLPWFEEMGIAPDENGELILTRQLMADGKNVCRVGGVPCTTVQLRALGRQLINIHGQHDSQQLLDERTHLHYLDSFGALQEQLESYGCVYEKLLVIRQEMNALRMDEAEKSRRIDTLEYQIKELEQANLIPEEEAELAERQGILRNSGKLMEAVERAYFALLGEDEQLGAVSLLADAEGALAGAGGISSELAAAAESLAEVRYTADDLANTLRSLRDSFEFSPQELDRVEERLDLLYRLKKKYGNSVEEMLQYLEACKQELDQIQMADDILKKLEQDYEGALLDTKASAETLSKARQDVSEVLREKIEEELRQLDMPKVQFSVAFQPKTGALPFDQSGMDEVQFLMSANLGEDKKPLQKVASGGELSRIMLALQNVLTENDTVSTLIFDEVDSGVSGRAAQKVAEKMGALAKKRQILCVTHLAQLAAMADLHFSVQKGEKDGRTHTVVTALERDRRVEELARLTGGVHVSDAIIQGAGELLGQAEAYKKQLKK